MITVERQVGADPSRVWDVVGDVDRWAELLPTVTRVVPQTEGGPRVGSRYALTQPGIPPLVYEITGWEPGARFVWVARAPGVRTVGVHQVEQAPGGTLLRLGLRWEGPLARLVRLFFGRRTRSYVEQEADAFTTLAEQHER